MSILNTYVGYLFGKPGDVIITGDEPTETMMGDGLDVGQFATCKERTQTLLQMDYMTYSVFDLRLLTSP